MKDWLRDTKHMDFVVSREVRKNPGNLPCSHLTHPSTMDDLNKFNGKAKECVAIDFFLAAWRFN